MSTKYWFSIPIARCVYGVIVALSKRWFKREWFLSRNCGLACKAAKGP
jgi:hypothetical protein